MLKSITKERGAIQIMSNVINFIEAGLRMRVRREIAEFANSPLISGTELSLRLAALVEQMDKNNR